MKIFYQLLANTIVSNIVNMTVWFALTYFVYLQTRSVTATGIMSGLYLVATAFSGFWLGSLVDRHEKKSMMMLSSVISVIVYVIGFAVYLIGGDEAFKSVTSPTLWTFVPLMLFGVLAGNIRGIALPIVVTILIAEDKRDKANGMVGTAGGVSFLIVSVISGFLVGLAGMYWVLVLAIVLNIATIVHLWFVPLQEKKIVHALDGSSHKIDIKGTLKVISGVPGLIALILFTTVNNFLGGVFMSLMDAYGLSMVSVQVWGLIWGGLSTGFIVGGLIIAKKGLGKNPLRSLFLANIVIWSISSVFAISQSIVLLIAGMFVYLCVVPFIEAAEHTIIQKVVPKERQGRVFGFAQSVEQMASPLTAFMIGPLTEFVFIPFMTTGAGVELVGPWFGVGAARGIALVFTVTGLIGLVVTTLAMKTKYYRQLSEQYAR